MLLASPFTIDSTSAWPAGSIFSGTTPSAISLLGDSDCERQDHDTLQDREFSPGILFVSCSGLFEILFRISFLG